MFFYFIYFSRTELNVICIKRFRVGSIVEDSKNQKIQIPSYRELIKYSSPFYDKIVIRENAAGQEH